MKRRTRLVTKIAGWLGGALALLAMNTSAHAQQWPTADPSYSAPAPGMVAPDAFGAAGTMAITADFDLDLRHVSQSFMGQSDSGTQVTISPELLVFMAPNFAIGGLLGLQHTSAENFKETGLSLGPLAAYNIPIGPQSSVFPVVGLLYTWGNQTVTTPGGKTDVSGYDISLLLKVPVLFHPFQHVFVGFGPFIELDLVAKQEGENTSKTRTMGLTLDFGLWL